MGNYEELSSKKEFKATPIKCLYNSEDYKIYACTINGFTYPQIKASKYGTVTIKGDIQELNLDCEYIIKASEMKDKYGVSYQVVNIRSEKPVTLSNSRTFLQEILTYQQAETLLSIYPDIIDRIINNRLDDIDLNKTKGIKETTFEKIKHKVIENFKLAELVDEFSGIFSFSIIKKLYAEYTSIEKIRENLHTKPYECLCRLGGVGFKTADELLLKVDEVSKEKINKGEKPIIDFKFDLLSSDQRAEACALYVLDQNETDGNTYMSIKDFVKECDNLAPEIKFKLINVIKSCDEIYFDKEKLNISKRITYQTEKDIADILKDALKVNKKWHIDVSKYQQLDDEMTLTDEQLSALTSVCENTISILQGGAGVGKSSSVLALIKLLNENHKSVIQLAPTGRAAKVLQSYTKYPASTIHRGLGYKPPNKWTYDKNNKLFYDIVIIDETSMIDVFLFKHLLDAIDFTRTKLLIIGDNAQIPSVSCGNVLQDLLNSKMIPTVSLTKVFRYGKGGLSTVATDIRNGSSSTINNKDEIQIIGDDKGFTFIPLMPDRAIDYIVKMYKTLLSKGFTIKDIMVVVAQNKGKYGSQVLNNQIQNAVNPSTKEKIVSGETEYRLGDPIIQCVNDYKAQKYLQETDNVFEESDTFVPNGDIGVITEIKHNGIVVDFDDNRIFIPKDKFQNIKLAYSLSMHKCIPSDTILYTDRGQIILEELNNGAEINTFKEIHDSVLIYNGDSMESPKSFYNAGMSDCKKIVTSRGYEFIGTLDHKIKVLNKNGDIVMKELSQIDVSDYVLISKNNNIYNDNDIMPMIDKNFDKGMDVRTIKYPLPKQMTEDFATLLGMIVADGCVANKKVCITYAKNHRCVVEYYSKLIKKLFNYDIAIRHIDGIDGGYYHANISSKFLNKYFSLIDGLRPNDKYVPNCILKSSRKIQSAFLRGLFEDGAVNCKGDKFDHIEFVSHSHLMIKQVKMMLLNQGIICTQRTRHNNEYLYIYKSDARIFAENIGFIDPIKQDRLLKCLSDCRYSTNYTIPYILNSIKNYTLLHDNYKKYTKREKALIRDNKSCSIKALQSIVNNTMGLPKNIYDKIQYLCNDVYLDKVSIISDVKKHCYCLEMPINHYFVQDGMIGSNCQGGQARIVIAFAPNAHTFMLNSNLLYVAVTRARERCYLISDYATYTRAIKKKENYARQTWLANLLQEE